MAEAAIVTGIVSTIGGIAAGSKKGRGPRAGAYRVDKTPFADKLVGAGPQAAIRKRLVGTLGAFEKGKDLEALADRDRKKSFAALRSGGRGGTGAKLRMFGKQQDTAREQAMVQRGQRTGQVMGALGSLRGQDIGLQKADKAALMNYERLRSGAAMQQDRAAMAADASDRNRMQAAWGAGAQGLGAIAGMDDGGKVSGPGTERSDSIPAMLSDGEFVVNAKTVRGLGKAKGGKNKAEDRALGMKFLYEVQEKFGKNPPFAGKNQSLNEERKIHEKNLKEDQEDDDKEFDEGQKKLGKKLKKGKKFLNKYIEVKKYNNGAQAGEGDSYDTRGEQEAVDFLKKKKKKGDVFLKRELQKRKAGKRLSKFIKDSNRPDRELGAGDYKSHEDFRRRQQKAKREAKLADAELGDGGRLEQIGRESLKKRKEEERRKQLSKDLEKQDKIRRETARKEKLEKLEKKSKDKDGKKSFAKALSGIGQKLSEAGKEDTYSRDLLAQRNPEIFNRDITSKSLDLKDGGGAKEEFIAALGPHVDKIIESYEFGRGFGEVLAAKNKLKAKKRK